MENVFIVMENNNESYEDNQSWGVAAFSNEADAEAHAISLKAALVADKDLHDSQFPAYSKESDSLYEALPFTWGDALYMEVTQAIDIYLTSKYPSASRCPFDFDHYFYVKSVVFIK